MLALLLRFELKKGSNVGYFENESNTRITENQMLVSARTPNDITIQYLKCIRRVAIKTALSFIMSACQFVRPREKTTCFPVDKFCDILY